MVCLPAFGFRHKSELYESFQYPPRLLCKLLLHPVIGALSCHQVGVQIELL